MTSTCEDLSITSRRAVLGAGGALLGGNLVSTAAALPTGADLAPPSSPANAPQTSPPGYNILFVFVDQEHFFDKWPFPVPGREYLKKNGITFANHQSASQVCSPARSVVYTGLHIQHTGVFVNMGTPWQPNASTDVKTIGHRLQQIGYRAAYQGKWHLSESLDAARRPPDASLLKNREIIESYGFADFLGAGDLIDGPLGGYSYDDFSATSAVSWLRTNAHELKAQGQPWFMAVNLVNPHDVMFVILLALTGKPAEAVARASDGLTGRDLSKVLSAPEQASTTTVRPAALFNYNMFSYLDAKWFDPMVRIAMAKAPAVEKLAKLVMLQSDWRNRGAIRSIFDGHYRFSRYFSPIDFNRPTTYEDLVAKNDLEVYDLQEDPQEARNLAQEGRAKADLMLALNETWNWRIDEEVGVDDRRFLPLRHGFWYPVLL